MKLSKLELVRGIQAVLSDESKWCKGTPARDKNGNATSSTDPEAKSFCVWGAGRRAAGIGMGELEKARGGSAFWDVMVKIGRYDPSRVSTGTVGTFNDSHTYAEVMDRLREVEAMYVKEEENAIAA